MSLRIGITCYPTVGGSGVVASELGKLLAEKGHEVHFITSGVPFRLNTLHNRIFFHEVSVNQYSVFQYPPYDIALASKMAETIKKEKLDILHVHYAVPHAVCAILAKSMAGTDVKIVTTLHGTDITVLGYDPTLAEAIKYGIGQSDGVTAVSHSLAAQTEDMLSVGKNIDVVPNFVDERVYRKVETPGLRERLGILKGEKVLIHVSNFRPVKRVPDVVSVFAEVAGAMPAKLILAGDGPDREAAEEMAKAKGLEDKVLFLGKQSHLEELYSISDAMLLLSEKESFGLVALEAMACGVPCIGTRIGGIPEVIEDGWNGYLCALGDVAGIAERTIALLRDEELQRKMSVNAQATPEERFGSGEIVSRYEALYERLLGR